MFIFGCDLNTRFQQIAMRESAGGGIIEGRLDHESGEAKAFYEVLPSSARIGMEDTGQSHWLERMLAEAKERIDSWRKEYYESRSHRALGERTPNEFAHEIAASRDFMGDKQSKTRLEVGTKTPRRSTLPETNLPSGSKYRGRS